MHTLEITEIGNLIEKTPLSMNLMFIGDTGIGKTQAIKKYCEESNRFVKILILSQLEASEALGIPVKGEKEFRGVKYPTLKPAIPEWVFELAEHENPILYLDEFFCSEPSTMNSFLNFLSEKNVEGIDLSHIKVVASTNIGKYTFEPDGNIISRFCMFYAVNSSFNKYIADPRIINDYVDENEKLGPIFEERSLKPRCQEELKGVPDELLSICYKGYTNKEYNVFHSYGPSNNIIVPFVRKDDDENSHGYYISEESFASIVSIAKSAYPRLKKWDAFVNGILNVKCDKSKLLETFENSYS